MNNTQNFHFSNSAQPLLILILYTTYTRLFTYTKYYLYYYLLILLLILYC